MKKLWKIMAVCLAVVLALPPLAVQGAESHLSEVGELAVYMEGQGTVKVPAVLYDEEIILVSPETAANLTGAELSWESDEEFVLNRDGYLVAVDTASGNIQIALAPEDGKAYGLYQGESFSLLVNQRAVFAQEEVPAVPLEQILYLMNVQWICADDRVYLYRPRETAWNVAADYISMFRSLPTTPEILGESVADHWGNSFKYGLLAFADEVNLGYLIPFAGAEIWEEGKTKESLLTLANPCENITGDLQQQAQASSEKFLGDLGKLASDIGQMGDSGAKVADKLIKSVSTWSQVELPSDVSDFFTGVDTMGKVVTAFTIAGRSNTWTEGYLSQLSYLSEVEAPEFGDFCGVINRTAASLAGEYENYPFTAAKEIGKIIAGALGDALAGKTPFGKAVEAYNLVHTFVAANLPAVQLAEQAGDNASAAKRLSDLSALVWNQYASVLADTINLESHDSTEAIARLRLVGSLLMNTATHSYDSLYSAWKNEYLAKNPEASASEILEKAGDTMTMEELGQKLVNAQTFLTRWEETSQYDPSLLLYGDMHNLASTTVGAYREKIPPEYVKFVVLPVFSSNIAQYQGTVYTLGKALPGLTEFTMAPGSYDYICAIGFYKNRLYYACKTTGTSEISSAIYVCNPDGSDLQLIADAPVGSGKPNCTAFLIQDDRLYYGYYGEAYYDLTTGESGECWGDKDMECGTRLASHRDSYLTYAPNGQYYKGYGTITFYNKEDQTETVIYENSQMPSIQIQAVTEDYLYFTTIHKDGMNCSLMRLNLQTLQAEELDVRPAVGSGYYFAW